MIPPAPFDLVIFDCDGVLVDSEPIAIRIDQIALERMGWPMSGEEIVERFVGKSIAQMGREVGEHLGRPLPEDFLEEFRPLYDEAFRRDLRPVEGVVGALDGIDRAGIPTCVGSSSTHERLRFKLGLTGLLPRFEGRIFSAMDVDRGKPAPDLFLFAAARMGVDPCRAAVVEDSRYGVEAARAAGMRAFGYAGGVTKAERLRGPGTTVFRRMRDLPDLLATG